MHWNQERDPDDASLPSSAKIIANLWYLIDEQGFIHSLRVHLYIGDGEDEDKLRLLKNRCYRDYLVARPFPVPEKYATLFIVGNETRKMPVIHHDSAAAIGGLGQLFFEALDMMGEGLPVQTHLAIPESPLIKVTALRSEPDGTIVPVDVGR